MVQRKEHRDDIDPKTGFTFPAVIWKDEFKQWHKYGMNIIYHKTMHPSLSSDYFTKCKE
jgi:hypothetical protein